MSAKLLSAATFVVGLLVSAAVSVALWPASTSVSDAPVAIAVPPELADLQAELKLLQSENRMLLAMVKAGMSGDISGHIQAFSAKAEGKPQSPPVAEPEPLPLDPTTAEISESKQRAVNAASLIERLQRADKLLQQQALAEGWATDQRLVLERQNLWEQARRQLPEAQYLQATFAAQRPNVLYIEGSNDAGQASEPLKYGDTLLSIDGQRLFTRSQYNHYLASLPAQPIVTLEVQRQGQRMQLTLNDPKRNLRLYADSVAAIR
ncbi:hypothetical protein [Ferrimonas senticii]|uniref:hypothetical protein n=1 Tax=Ferrimonas senticii TaxID=394566 RepID=UPI0003FD9942|nr:hypothetical protein [Ferrimonas senticii]